jgi:hypothetical protein
MKRFRWLLALLNLCLGASEAPAQFQWTPNPYFRPVHPWGGGFMFSGRGRAGSGMMYGGGSSSYSSGSYSPGPTQVTVIYVPAYTPNPEPAPPKKTEPKPAPRKPDVIPPRPPAPEENPFDECNRLIELGLQAFAGQEYGKASQRFKQAAKVAPNVARAYFLLSQAYFALGKYPEAVEAIHAGMALKPDWPTERFQPLELYGPNLADYPEHLARLEETVGRNPNDPDLLFLYAHQLWFDGRRDEARLLFQRALPGAADPNVIQRFLRALPGAGVVREPTRTTEDGCYC